jgi:hypothetical protein
MDADVELPASNLQVVPVNHAPNGPWSRKMATPGFRVAA